MRVEFSPPDITDAECQEVEAALRSGWITTGPRTKSLEKQVAERCGTTRAACLNSATASLELTLRVLGIGPGDEVIIPAYTYTASASPVVHVGATPVLVDAGQADDGYGLDPDVLAEALTPRTKAVVPVDIGGRMCDYTALREVVDSQRHLFAPTGPIQEALGRVALVADGAHSFGARRDGTSSGSAADFTTFSFHAVKNLTTAEGGAVTWRPELGLDEELYRQYMLLSLHGQSKDALAKTRLGAWEYDVVSPAYKCNMTDVCAAIGLAQMSRYDSMLARRRQIITRYDRALAPAGMTSLRHYENETVSSGHLYLANLPDLGEDGRNEFIEHMARADVACNVHYKPLPMLTAYRDLGFDIEDVPRAFDLYANEVSLPLHTSLSDEQVDYVIDCALNALAAVGR